MQATSTAIEMFGPGYWDNADEVAARLRQEGPAHRVVLPSGVPVWVVTRDEEARIAFNHRQMTKDSATVREVVGDALVEAGHPRRTSNMLEPSALFSDPPEHGRLRRPLQRVFTNRRIALLEPHVRQITRRLLDALPDEGVVDLIEAFAFPLPVTVICELLGVPPADRAPFRAWTAALMDDDPPTSTPASLAMGEYFGRLIAAKRARPDDGLLSALVQLADTEHGLTEHELIGTTFLLFVAGHETTMNLIGAMARWLMPDPHAWQALGADPGLVPAAVEEILRWDSPVRMATHRVTTVDVDLGGVVIPARSIVLICLGAANRDPRRHGAGADVLDIHRADGVGHLTFGHGIHFCLGAPLARMEARIALTELTARFPRARLAVPARELRQSESVIMKGLVGLPVEFRPPADSPRA